MTKIRTIRVLSLAKVNALLYGILGLLVAPFFLLGPGLAVLGGDKRPGGFAGLIVAAVIAPFMYAIFGFIAGAVMAFIYNAISHSVGGIEVELDLPPPPIAIASVSAIPAPPAPALNEVPPVRPEFE